MRSIRLLLIPALAPVLMAATAVDDLKLGLDSVHHGRMRDAEQSLRRAYDYFVQANPPQREYLNAAALALSSVYQFTGNIPEAERVLMPVFDEWTRTRNVDLHPAVDNLASIRAQQGRWNEALRLASESLDFARQRYGSEDPATLPAISHLANLSLEAGHTGDAARWLENGIALARKTNAGPLATASLICEFSKVKTVQRDFAAAIEAGRQGLAIASREEQQPMLVGDCSYALGAAYLQSGRIERAEPLIKIALARFEEAVGPDSPAASGVLMLLAEVHAANGRFSAAANTFVRAVTLLRHSFGKDDLEVAVGETKLAHVLIQAGKTAEGAALLGHAVPILEKMMPVPQPLLAMAYCDSATIAGIGGDDRSVEQLLKRSIALFEASDFRGTPYIDALRQYGAFLQRERRTEAREVLNRAKTMARALRQQ